MTCGGLALPTRVNTCSIVVGAAFALEAGIVPNPREPSWGLAMKIARPQPTFAFLEQRLANQTRRLAQGVRARTLTKAEAAPLRQRLSAAQVGLDGNGLHA